MGKDLTAHSKPSAVKSNAFWMAVGLLLWLVDWQIFPFVPPYFAQIILQAGINITLAVSLNLVNGFTGQFSMGHAGFMSVGGYMCCILTVFVFPELAQKPYWGGLFGYVGADQRIHLSAISFGLSLLAGGAVAAVAGWVVGLPSLRLKGDYLAIVTLGFGEIIRVVFLNSEKVGGPRGMPGVPLLSSFGWVFSFALFTIFVVWRIVNSSHGRNFMAVREDEIAAEAMGVNTTMAKVKAFVLGAFFAGVGGGLFAHQLQYINPAMFDFNKSFEFIIMVVLGGMGSITGSVFAAVFLTVIKEVLRGLQELTKIDFRMIIYSLLLIVLMLVRPNGLFGVKEITDFIPFMKKKRGAQ